MIYHYIIFMCEYVKKILTHNIKYYVSDISSGHSAMRNSSLIKPKNQKGISFSLFFFYDNYSMLSLIRLSQLWTWERGV